MSIAPEGSDSGPFADQFTETEVSLRPFDSILPPLRPVASVIWSSLCEDLTRYIA